MFFRILFDVPAVLHASVITMSTILLGIGIFDLPFMLTSGTGGVNALLDFANW